MSLHQFLFKRSPGVRGSASNEVGESVEDAEMKEKEGEEVPTPDNGFVYMFIHLCSFLNIFSLLLLLVRVYYFFSRCAL